MDVHKNALSVNPFAGLDLLSSAVLLLDDNNSIAYFNAGAENLFSVSARKVVGAPLTRLFSDP